MIESIVNKRDILDTSNRDKPGYIYLIRAEGTWLFKIGFSINPRGRIKQLETGSPLRLTMVAEYHCKNMWREERRWHDYFASVRRHGEWFELPPLEAWDVVSDFALNGAFKDAEYSNLAQSPGVREAAIELRFEIVSYIQDIEKRLFGTCMGEPLSASQGVQN